MAAIHSKDTKPEMVMLRYLRGRGLRSQLNIHGCLANQTS